MNFYHLFVKLIRKYYSFTDKQGGRKMLVSSKQEIGAKILLARKKQA